ncbi:putative CocE/NonD family hydrolase [Chryseobacterium ginsenosidimutans]|uniref:CocE/NonD family hydrolase n=1 Tax=Chryseobacterium ginsenosidimutans TaxID=687846 RepID=UPI0021682F07|nr:CocE/NonD family hydrolase [Chryseobacterium ginsenosidimutans]MCS3868156.1 putative CocE/NonD family hydrolase [Chryseobacterium ginsenosidimutans]
MNKSFLLFFLFVFGFGSSQKGDEKNLIIQDSIIIKTKDDGTLSLTLILNKNKLPENTVLVNTIYPDPKNIDLVKNFVNNDYVAVILNSRGKYLSENTIEPFEHEANDINEVIDWIIKQPWSNGKVGMIGGSYLGFSQWAATKNLHPALKTIVPEAATGIGTINFPMINNIFSCYSLQWLDYVTFNKTTNSKSFYDQKKWNSVFKTWYQSGLPFRKLDSISGKPNYIFQRWLDHPNYDEYWKKMIPYHEDFSKITIPILSTTGYFDADKSGALYYFREHNKYKKENEHYLIIGPYDHSGAQGFIKNELRGYKIDPVASIDLNKIWLEWFDYIFKNQPKPSFLKDKINFQVMGTNEWRSTRSMDVFEKNKAKFYLNNEEGNLSLSNSKTGNNNFSTLKIDLKDRTDADELLSLKYNIVDDNLYTKNNLLFKTEPFKKSLEFSGSFSGDIVFSVNKKDADLYLSLYEETTNGQYFLLSSYVTRASYANDSERRTLLTAGKIKDISFINNDFVSKKIEKGSKLIVMIGVVKSPYWQLNYGTGKEVSTEDMSDAKEPMEIKLYNKSYIEFPLFEKSK